MSADNWTICPKCKKTHETKLENQRAKVSASYGKVPASEYMAAITAIDNPPKMGDTLREDYCQGMSEDGVYSSEYSCSCNVCKFSYTKKFVKNALEKSK